MGLLDIAILALTAIVIVVGLLRGWFKQLSSMFEIILFGGLILLLALGIITSPMFFKTTDDGTALTKMGTSMSGWFSGMGSEIPGGDVFVNPTDTDEVSTVLAEELGLPSFICPIAASVIASLASANDYVFASIGEMVEVLLGYTVLKVIVFIIGLAIVIAVAIIIRTHISKTRFWNPTYKKVDILVGGAWAVLVMYVILAALLGVVAMYADSAEPVVNYIGQNGFATWLYNNNLFGKLLAGDYQKLGDGKVAAEAIVNIINAP